MNTSPTPRRKLNRRDFLKLAAVVGVAGAGGYLLYEYAPWLDYDQQAQLARTPFETGATGPAQMRELARYATLAANGHNTQPWMFNLREDGVDIYADFSRRLPIVDPDDRELWISLGCALENLLVAARATGHTTEVTYPDADDVIRVQLTPDAAQESPLFAAIPQRQNTRSEYNGQAVETAQLDQLIELPLEPGIALHFVTGTEDMETVVEYVNQGTLSQYADKAFLDELIDWLRFNKKEALASLDGLFTGATGNPEVPRWVGQMFVAGTNPQQQADGDTAKLRSAPHALVIASESEGKASWVRTGQVYERMALTMTSLGIQSAFLNQPLEVPDVRSQFQSALGLGDTLPQLLIRFGYGSPMPRSLRRPVESVVIPA
ncbi:MAG: nitroreductase family protein [Anaerolineae bacterium]|nr:nitroreductase family protein [Anaerolineae bacterium]